MRDAVPSEQPRALARVGWKEDLEAAGKTVISPGEAFAQRLREVRERRRLSQAQLAKRLDELSHSIDRVVLTRIEAGGQPKASAANKVRAQNIRLKDVLAICAALNVSPAHMLAPYDDDQYIRIVPEIRPSIPGMARGWFAGRFSLGESDEAEWMTEIPPEDLLRMRFAQEQYEASQGIQTPKEES